MRVYVPRLFVLSRQRFGVMDIKAPSACHSSRVLDRPCYSSQVSNGPCYISQTNQCYSSMLQLYFIQKIAGKIHLRGVRAHRSKDTRRRVPQHVGESELALAPLFICLPLPGPVLCKLGQPGVLLVLPEVLTPVLGPSFVLFSWAFPFLVFQPSPFWTPFPYSIYLTESSIKKEIKILCIYRGQEFQQAGSNQLYQIYRSSNVKTGKLTVDLSIWGSLAHRQGLMLFMIKA